MSAALLLPSHPTVLRLRPFSSNNACQSPQSSQTPQTPGSSSSSSGRGFPVLAVTRGSRLPRHGSARQGTQPLQRVMSERSPRRPERDVPYNYQRRGQRARSEYLDRSHAHDAALEVYRSVPDILDADDVAEFGSATATGYVDLRDSLRGAEERQYHHQQQQGLPESLEELTFSEHLVTAVAPSPSSLSTAASRPGGGGGGHGVPDSPADVTSTTYVINGGEVSSRVISNNNVTSTSMNTVATGTSSAMARPVIKSPPLKHTDKRYYLPHNGIWRTVTFTPGEVDLNRFAHKAVGEAVAREAAGKEAGPGREEREGGGSRRSRYKLNASQIPRSSTPVQENDPDKLNMRQVIAFLQSRGGKVTAPPTRQQIRQSRISSVDIGQPRPDAGPGSMDLALRPSKGAQKAPHVSSFSGPHRPRGVAPPAAGVASASQPLSVVTYSGMPLRSSPPLVRRAARCSGREDGGTSQVMREEVRTLAGEEATSEKADSSLASSSFKSVRQFRLHRFLSAAPGSAEVKTALNGREGSPAPRPGGKTVAFAEQPSIIPPQPSSSAPHSAPLPGEAPSRSWQQADRHDPRHSYRFGRRSETDVIRRRLPARVQSGQLSGKSRRQRLKSAPAAGSTAANGVIRLPSMADLPPDSDHDSDREDSAAARPGSAGEVDEEDVTAEGEELPEAEVALLRSLDSHQAKPAAPPCPREQQQVADPAQPPPRHPGRSRPAVGALRRSSSDGVADGRRSEVAAAAASPSSAATVSLQRLTSTDSSRKTPEEANFSSSRTPPADEEVAASSSTRPSAVASPSTTRPQGVASPPMRPSAVISPSSTGRRRSSGTLSQMSSFSPRKLHIKVPREPMAGGSGKESTPRTPDVVKLSLRKERTRTREHTYMTDMAEGSPRPAWELEGKAAPMVMPCDAQTAMSPRGDVVQDNGLS